MTDLVQLDVVLQSSLDCNWFIWAILWTLFKKTLWEFSAGEGCLISSCECEKWNWYRHRNNENQEIGKARKRSTPCWIFRQLSRISLPRRNDDANGLVILTLLFKYIYSNNDRFTLSVGVCFETILLRMPRSSTFKRTIDIREFREKMYHNKTLLWIESYETSP